LKKTTIVKTFGATGLSPFEPEVIVKRFNTKQGILEASSHSRLSALGTSERRKTKGTLRQFVKDRAGPQTQSSARPFCDSSELVRTTL
jgi:hypothetical protein